MEGHPGWETRQSRRCVARRDEQSSQRSTAEWNRRRGEDIAGAERHGLALFALQRSRIVPARADQRGATSELQRGERADSGRPDGCRDVLRIRKRCARVDLDDTA